MFHCIVRRRVIFSGILFLLMGCDDPRAQTSSSPRPVKTVVVDFQQGKNKIVQTGEIRPHTETSLSFRLDGRMITRSVDVGAQIKAGDVIATLDRRDSENQLNNAQADLTSAISAERLAKSNLTRMQLLTPGKAIAPIELDQAKSNWESAVSRRENALIAVKSAKERLSYTRLTSVESGVITTVSANPGQVLNAGQEVVKLASVAERDAVFDVPEQLLNQKNTDPIVTVSLLSDPAVKTVGHIRDISPQADATTRTFRIRVALENPPDAFILGASVSGEVQLPDVDSVKLPASSLTSTHGQAAVYLVDPVTLTLHVVPIHVVRYTTTDIYVSAGLKPGNRVVVAGVNKLRPDMKVALDKDQN